MPRYFFHVRSGSELEMDREGLDFPSLDEAIADARQAGAEMLLDQAVEDTRSRSQSMFEIVDASSGQVVAKVPFSG
jgi:predicted peroxiredoxin